MEQESMKYEAKNAPVKKHGGNDAIHDGKVSNIPIGESPKDPANKK